MILTPRQLDLVICALVSVCLFLAYWTTMPRVVTFEDSGLFLQVCHFNGIAHPPGYPLFTLLCAPWFLMPFDPVILGNSLSILFAILTCVVVYFVLNQIGVRKDLAGFTSLLFGLSLDYWSQAIIIEVYTLNTFLLAIAICLAVRLSVSPHKKYLFALSFVLGLGIANHWPLVVLSIPGIGLICLASMNFLQATLRTPMNFLICLLLGLLGLSPYLLMVLKQDPYFSFSGPINSVDMFYQYFMREAYADVDQSSTAGLMDKLHFSGWLAGRSMMQFGYLFGLIGVLGLVRGFVTMRWINAGLLLVFLSNTILLVSLLGFDFDFSHRTAFRVYPMVAWLCMSLWVGVGLQWITEFVPAHKALQILCIVAIGSGVAFKNLDSNDRRRDRLADAYARQVLQNLAPGAVLIVASDPQVGSISYLNQVVGFRPDVTLYQAENLFFKNKLLGETLSERKSFATDLPLMYSIGVPWLLQGEDYGLFLKHDGNLNGHAVIPKLRQFTDDLVYNYKEGLIRNPNTLHFAHQLLIGFGSQLTHYAFTHEIDEEVLAMWQSVQQTFPGMLATLSTVSANPQYPMPDDVMLGMARRFENSFGIETTDLEIATYYFYLALILVSPDATLEKDETLALSYLNLGLKAFPGPDNPGLCLRSKLIPLAELPGQGNPCQ